MLQALITVARFDTVVMFLSDKDKGNVRKLLSALPIDTDGIAVAFQI